MKRIIFICVGIWVICASCGGYDSNLLENKQMPGDMAFSIDSSDITSNRTTKCTDEQQGYYFVIERLPIWFVLLKLLDEKLVFQEKYQFDNRINPMYLEEDFDGDTIIDLAIPILEIKTGKKGIAVIHGGKNKIAILGAGKKYKNGQSDDIGWYTIWFVNREKTNQPGVDDTPPLILSHPSIQIEKSEVGGGQLFWNGKEYEYFHQTC